MWIIGEVLLIPSIGVHHVDVIVPTPIGHEGNPCLFINTYHQQRQTDKI